jgi:hypothetical protein
MTAETFAALVEARRTGQAAGRQKCAALAERAANAPPDLATAALEYAACGWLVVPLHSPKARGCSCGRADCANPGKHPRTRRGLKDASCDADTIREWWRRWPDANIGIVTGPESGILVLDVDGKQGEESLIELARRGCRLPDTFTARTGGGGQHLYFRWPEGADVRNSQSKIAPGLDIRGQGGYVVAPPSLHASGQRYEVNESAIPPAPCPEWLLSLIRCPPAAQAQQSAPAAGAPIGKGQRTNRLVSLAGSMHKREMAPAAIEAALLAENAAKCSPPLPEEKVKAIAHDIPALYPNPTPEEKPSLKPDLVCLADVEARCVDWLWEPFVPLRMLSMISGDPGAGKSFVALAVAADLSRGKLRDGRIVDPANTLYLTVENPTAEVMRPRFDLLGGDPARLLLLQGVHTLDEGGSETRRAVTLGDVDSLDAAIRETGARLVIVDPIQSYLGASVDLHRANETRPIMDGLARLADIHGCAILLLRHLNKQTGGKAINRGLGSIDLTGAVRSEMLAGSLPDDPETRAFIHIKSNVGRIGKALGYAIDSQGRLAWTGESGVTAADLLAAPIGPGDRKLAEAAQWLTEQLKTGSREQKEVREMAEQAGITYPTLRRAKGALQVRSHKAGMSGPWMWSLPEGAHDHPEGAQENAVSAFEELSTFDSECGGLLQ